MAKYDITKPLSYYQKQLVEARTHYRALIEKLAQKMNSNPRNARGNLTITAQELNIFCELIRDAEEEVKEAEALVSTAKLLEPTEKGPTPGSPNTTGASQGAE
jgi:hypothetical protein